MTGCTCKQMLAPNNEKVLELDSNCPVHFYLATQKETHSMRNVLVAKNINGKIIANKGAQCYEASEPFDLRIFVPGSVLKIWEPKL